MPTANGQKVKMNELNIKFKNLKSKQQNKSNKWSIPRNLGVQQAVSLMNSMMFAQRWKKINNIKENQTVKFKHINEQ